MAKSNQPYGEQPEEMFPYLFPRPLPCTAVLPKQLHYREGESSDTNLR